MPKKQEKKQLETITEPLRVQTDLLRQMKSAHQMLSAHPQVFESESICLITHIHYCRLSTIFILLTVSLDTFALMHE